MDGTVLEDLILQWIHAMRFVEMDMIINNLLATMEIQNQAMDAIITVR